MISDLDIAFLEKPKNLDKVLEEHSFELKRIITPNEAEGFFLDIHVYSHFLEGKSGKHIDFMYFDGNDSRELWKQYTPEWTKIISTGLLFSFKGNNEYDKRKREDLIKDLKERYEIIIINRIEGEII